MRARSKGLFCFLVAGAMLGMSPAARAETPGNWYAGLSGDFTWPKHADMGGGGNIDLGYRFAPTEAGTFRAEAEAGYHSADGEDGFGDLRYFTYMGNVFYDFARIRPGSETRSLIRPYVGGGIGIASVRVGQGSFSSTFDDHNNVFAYQGMAGLSFAASETSATEWTVGYRYLGSEEEGILDLQAHNLELGVRMHF